MLCLSRHIELYDQFMHVESKGPATVSVVCDRQHARKDVHKHNVENK